MRIGFDLAPLTRRYSPGLARAVRVSFGALRARGRLEAVALEPATGRSDLAWRQAELPRLARRLDLAGLHSFTSAFPLLAPCPAVQTVHELPWCRGERENAGLAHRLWARHGWRRAARVATASAQVARELEAEVPGARGRLWLAPWALDPSLSALAAAPPAAAWGLGPGYLLMVGATRPKKRLAEAVEAAARVARGRALVVTGPRDPGLVRAVARAEAVGVRLEHRQADDDEALAALYAHAGALLSLARSEGFGLPVLEALAFGCPVVAPAGSVQAETAGGLAETFADARSEGREAVIEALAAAIERALAAPGPAAPGEAAAARRRRAACFGPERAAEALEALWGELA